MKQWWKCAGIRALKSMGQMGVIMLTGVITISEVNWLHFASGVAMAGILSLLTSIAGLPELEGGDNATNTIESNGD